MKPTTKDKFVSQAVMLLKASLGVGLAALASGMTGADFGPIGNAVALIGAQAIVHAIDVFGLRK